MKKRNSFFAAALVCVLAASLLTACDNGGGSNGKGDYGRLTITVGEFQVGTARTLYPTASEFTRYEVTFMHPKASRDALAVTPGTAETVELLSGSWIVSTLAYTGTGGHEAVGAQDISVVTIVKGETITEDVVLEPLTVGVSGTFSYAVTLPADTVDSAVLAIAADDGSVVEDGVVDLTTLTPIAGKRVGTISLAAGSYHMSIGVVKDAAGAARAESLRIYPNLTTTAIVAFTDADLISLDPGPLKPPVDPDPVTPPVDADWKLAITVSKQASQEVIVDAIAGALEDASLTGASPDGSRGEVWTVLVNGRTLSADGLVKLYTGITAALPKGDIILDLSGCNGTTIAFANLVGSAPARQAIRDRIVAITLPDSVITINSGALDGALMKAALSGFSRLKEVSGKSVIMIGDNAFWGCTSLTTMDFPKVLGVGESAFSGCTALGTGHFPYVISFGNFAFHDCTALTALTLGDNPPKVDLIFDNLSQAITFSVPKGTKAAYTAAYSASPWGETGLKVTIVEK